MTTPTPGGLAFGFKTFDAQGDAATVTDLELFATRITDGIHLGDSRLDAFAEYTDAGGRVTIPEGLRDTITATRGWRGTTRLTEIVRVLRDAGSAAA